MNKCIIGVDAGGTKTEVKAFTLDGKEIISKIGGSGTLATNVDENLKNIVETIDDVYKDVISEYECIYIQLGISGIGAFNRTDEFKDELINRFNTKVGLVSDAELALYSIIKDEHKEGILVLAGTGSACFGIKDQKISLVGGWGHLLGDEGGSYNLAINALKMIINEEDDNKQHCELSKVIMDRINITSAFDLKKYVYNNEKATIASLSKVISECAMDGNKDAIGLLQQSGKDLGRFVCQIYKKLDMESDVLIGMRGSLIQKAPFIRESFEKEIKQYIPNYIITSNNLSPIIGAYYMVKKKIDLGEL